MVGSDRETKQGRGFLPTCCKLNIGMFLFLLPSFQRWILRFEHCLRPSSFSISFASFLLLLFPFVPFLLFLSPVSPFISHHALNTLLCLSFQCPTPPTDHSMLTTIKQHPPMPTARRHLLFPASSLLEADLEDCCLLSSWSRSVFRTLSLSVVLRSNLLVKRHRHVSNFFFVMSRKRTLTCLLFFSPHTLCRCHYVPQLRHPSGLWAVGPLWRLDESISTLPQHEYLSGEHEKDFRSQDGGLQEPVCIFILDVVCFALLFF